MSAQVRPGIENQPPGAQPWRPNLNERVICPDCRMDPPDIIEENASLVCGNCGVVLQDRLVSYESEWRTFNSDEGKGEDPNRVGDADNELLSTSNAGTMIGGGGFNVSKETRKLKKAQALQQDSKADKALTTAYGQIEAWGDKAALTHNVKHTAKSYYKQVYDNNALRGKPVDAILAGCLMLATRRHKVARTFAEIMALTSVPKKEVGRTFKTLEKFFNQNTQKEKELIETTGGIANETHVWVGTTSQKPEELCARYSNMVGLNFRVQKIAEDIAKKIPDSINDLAGRSPLSNAAACVYFAGQLLGHKKTTKQIAEASGVSEATIKQAYKVLYAQRERIVEKEWLGPQRGDSGFGSLDNLPA